MKNRKTRKDNNLKNDNNNINSINDGNNNYILLLIKCLFILLFGCIAYYVEFLLVYIIVVCIYLIFANLNYGPKKAGYSAYSVFNEGCYRIPGTINASQFEQEMRHGYANVGKKNKQREEFRTNEGLEYKSDHFKRKSKGANKPCICGSGKKYKHCCSLLRYDPSKDADKELNEWLD